MSTTCHPCPCCGHRTYQDPAGGTWQLCPVCAWEDAIGEAAYNGSNQVSLAQGQRNFLLSGVCEEQFRDIVRSPLPGEARSSQWLSFDALRERTISRIEREFHHLTRDGGITLHQMDLVDGGWPIKAEAMKAAEEKDPEDHWEDIPPGKLTRFSQSLAFLDDRGFRFYLPAFMRHGLITSSPEISDADLDGVLWSLDGGPRCNYRGNSFSALSHGQRECVAAFLQLFASWGDDFQAPYARKGLKRGWDALVPNFLKLAMT